MNKTPRAICDNKAAYDVIDLSAIPDDYLPRSNYEPLPQKLGADILVPHFLGRPMPGYYRHVHRRLLALSNERSLISALIPKGTAHIDGVFSMAFSSSLEMCAWNGISCSLCLDFYVRSMGKTDLRKGNAWLLPVPMDTSDIRPALAARALRLNCLTTHYADLWNEVWPQVASAPAWSLSDPRLSPWPSPTATWHRHAALRNHFERRWALVEIDALAALELKLTIDELCTIYRTQFPVLREYEKNTWYDRNGRIAFTVNRGLTGVGLERKAFELWQACLKENKPLPPDFDRQSLEPPFDVRDREDDMRTAYTFFARTLALPLPPPPS